MVPSSGNAFADLGLRNAEEKQTKAKSRRSKGGRILVTPA